MAEYSKIFLASNSPRRKELLTQLGVAFEQVINDFDETPMVDENAVDYVERLALGKAQSAQKYISDSRTPILAADTIVVLDGQLLGKPKDSSDAINTLKQLSGKEHQVLTSVVLMTEENLLQKTSANKVKFEDISEELIEAYCKTGEPMDKAGSYAIQGVAASFIELLHGSFSGVMGLPLNETRQMLDKIGVKYLLNQ